MEPKRVGLIVGLLVVIVIGGIGAIIITSHRSSSPKVVATPTPSPQTRSTDQVTSGEIGPAAITIKSFSFGPASLTVKQGTTVTWTNQDSADHSVISDSGSGVSLNSALLAQGDQYSFTFTTAGTFAYHCGVHPDMHGTVVVTP